MPTGYKREDVKVAEWHCPFSKAAHVLGHYIDHALSNDSKHLFVDVGCGLSSMGVELIQSRTNGGSYDGQLLLLDISPDLVERLQQLYAADPAISCLQGDCRDMRSLDDGCATVVIDKGTLDALCGEDDKIAMLKVCSAMTTRRHIPLSDLGILKPPLLRNESASCPHRSAVASSPPAASSSASPSQARPASTSSAAPRRRSASSRARTL